MILKRFYEDSLAHASYMVGCPKAGEAAVIDPNRDVENYIDAAAAEGLRIVAVTETHIHADYLSGSRQLALTTGAMLYLSDEGDDDWKYAFASEAGATLVRDGDSFRIGALRFDVLRTTGHTPEHISFVLTDEAASLEPAMVFTGDFVFVGEVGRPDLLENAAGVKGTMEPGARELYRSIQRFKSMPDHALVWPSHGAGSACGKSLGGVPVTTVGFERRANWAFRAATEESFVREVLSGQPEPPKYFATMKRLNKSGPPVRNQTALPRVELQRDAIVVDTRASSDFARGHVPGSMNIPIEYKSFVTWAGWLLPCDRDILLLAETEDDARNAVRRLSLIGLDRVSGWAPVAEGALTESYAEGSFAAGVPAGAFILDVRGQSEWDEGRVPGAAHIPLGYLTDRLDEIPRDRPVAVHCQGGGRSPIAASVLQRAGIKNVVDLTDGYLGFEALAPSGTSSRAV
ncbi:MAG TPA: MBL fold metallo-hydrolase [Fimbriimonadaceae bacterium]|nr:MBL fold metallo-hydrolase [Fimbriimonadaceae bacterium]